MKFEDAITIRLASQVTRAGLFDEVSLAQIAAAAYDLGGLALEQPWSAAFDSVELGVSLPRIASLDGSWQSPSGTERRDLRLTLAGFGERSTIAVNALWRGRIIARGRPATGRIVDVQLDQLDLSGLDADINPLPEEPAALESARREQVAARLRAVVQEPATIDAALIDRWLAAIGAPSVSAVLETPSTSSTEAVRITFSPPAAGPSLPVALPVTAALMARDLGFDVAVLLAESKAVREQLVELGLGPPRDRTLPRLRDAVPVWIVPMDVFDDDDWPGATLAMNPGEQRTARRLAAGAWLAREGIGLAAVP